MSTVRVEPPSSPAGPGVTAGLRKRWLVAVLVAAFWACLGLGGVFLEMRLDGRQPAASVALRRAKSARRAASAEGSAKLSVASVRAAIPRNLAAAAPIELSIQPPPTPKPPPQRPARSASVIAPRAPPRAPVRTVQAPVRTVQAPVRTVQAPARTVQAPARTVQAPAPPAPAPSAPVSQRSAPASRPAPSHSSSSVGETFESSG